MYLNSILQTIGNTPLVKLNQVVCKEGASVYLKLEYFNPTGSYKDRMAVAVIEEAEKRGVLKPGMTVIENTAGSTGTSLAMVCATKGYRFLAISSDAFSTEKLQAMKLFGAELELITNLGRGITADLVPRMISHAETLSKQKGYYWTRQFENTDVLTGYRHMGKEITTQVPQRIHTFCAAVGTAGMFAGVGGELKKTGNIQLIAFEPASAPLLSKGFTGTHYVEGIAPGFIPPFMQHIDYDDVHTVEEADARIMAQRLIKEEGVFAGLSTGLNVVGAVRLAQKLTPVDVVVTVACDSGMKYLSRGLFS